MADANGTNIMHK